MHYIKETNHLNELCSKLNKSEFLSIDTEFIREKTYWPVSYTHLTLPTKA